MKKLIFTFVLLSLNHALAADRTIIIGGDTSMYRSTDSGETFQAIPNTPTNMYVIRSLKNTIFAAGYDGIWISKDQGKSFIRAAVAKGVTFHALEFRGNNIYAFANTDGLFVSKDVGISFHPVSDADYSEIHDPLYKLSYMSSGRILFNQDRNVFYGQVKPKCDELFPSEFPGFLDTNFIFGDVQKRHNWVYTTTLCQNSFENTLNSVSLFKTNLVTKETVPVYRSSIISSAPGLFLTDYSVYLATNDGLAISFDRGTNFVTRTVANGLGDDYIEDVYTDDDVTIYAATANGLSISEDLGETFITKPYSEFYPVGHYPAGQKRPDGFASKNIIWSVYVLPETKSSNN